MSCAGGLYLNMTLPTTGLKWQLAVLSLLMNNMSAKSWASLTPGKTWLLLREQAPPTVHTLSGFWSKTLTICPLVMIF